MKRNLLRKEEDSDPMSVVSNLFDVAMVFAVALMVALVTRYNMTEMFSQEDFEGGNLAASKIRNLECPSYEICLIDYGCGKFNRKIHIMEQYP